MKEIFLMSEFWNLSLKAAFLRSPVFITHADAITGYELRHAFSEGLRYFIDDELLPVYKSPIFEVQHLQHIAKLIAYAAAYGHGVLKDNSLNYGVAQMLLNQYLKYLWAASIIERPIHFPVDNRIQELLGMGKSTIAWRKLNSEQHYMTIINRSKEMLNNNYHSTHFNNQIGNIAELELYLTNTCTTY